MTLKQKKNAGYFCIRHCNYSGLLFFWKGKSLFTLKS